MTFDSARPPGSEWYSRPLRLVLIYVIVGGLWVGVSDVIQLNFAFFPIAVDRLIFIAITAVLSYIVVRENRIVIEQSRAAENESAARIRAYFNSAAEGLIVVDSQGRIVDANAKVVQMFGYTEPELIGQPIEMLAPERLRGQHGGYRAEYMRAPISRPMGFGRDPVGRRKDGSEFPIEVSLSYFATRQGGIVTGYITDVTERRQLEFQSRRSEAMAAIGTVAAGVAHELNNPLAIISARAELVIAEASNRGLPDQLLNDLQVIHRNAHRASRVATELLTLARTPQKSHKPLNLNDLVNEIMLLFREQTARDGIQIETALDPQLPPVSGDHTALSQVLTNLLSNAREAMPAGGIIRMKTCSAAQPQAVRLTVEDTGNGIPDDAAAKIFDLFYTTKSTGTGLGLWLSKRAGREHGGTIEVKSQVGQGTIFIVTLPALRTEPEQTPDPIAIPQAGRS
ncbi:MAG: PAS domain S-box protein [Candidatus Binataceae bacterium]|nr:PAS domain S-box protein [Candidatus Binataceae bacterium]